MDEQSVAKRMKRQASMERTALRKAEAAAEAVKEEEAAKEKALLCSADQPAAWVLSPQLWQRAHRCKGSSCVLLGSGCCCGGGGFV